MYLVPEVNEDAKRENKNAMKKAVAIKAERLLGIRKEAKSSDETALRKASPVFYEWLLDYHKGLIDSQAYSLNYIKNVWKLIAIMHQYMKYSHKSGIRLIDFNKNVYVGFLNYMRTSMFRQSLQATLKSWHSPPCTKCRPHSTPY